MIDLPYNLKGTIMKVIKIKSGIPNYEKKNCWLKKLEGMLKKKNDKNSNNTIKKYFEI